MLTFRFEKSAIVTTPTIRHDITDTHTTIPNSLNSVVSARATVSDTLKDPEDTRGRDRMASIIHILLVTE